MTRVRGVTLQLAAARYLSLWWPSAESAGSGRNGRDILGTPGVAFEVKTARKFSPLEFCRQARRNAAGDVPVVVYVPERVGEASAAVWLAILPLADLMDVLVEAKYAPEPREE
jgi:hypothetical protein